ncbi:hypothetical protein AL536_05610 [Vibrio fluvialis]|uniref:Uncharacterized protein n=1 Tax=Vibrio fluvialis TaxID=676 RepID=A0AAX2LSL3_VIBFL|nr:hypothetical protein [Vibrio fluvialis]AMF92937.1 hypothetical protein AL536_05610 [Vibrio fluvialis]EKO4011705.1 hypothetical protein [Vibrio fluvialis]MBY8229614.1 hypothetical protein [Vibrio fluvialis]MCE7633065.1 hypothetical protein [Vibrio fluvialis]SUQ26285.1 Uncharacterised protein [Vibrio fluvialis]
MPESVKHPDRLRAELEISSYVRRVEKYHTNLNNSGIWLFLAILGCWGVQSLSVKLFAVTIAFILFSHKLTTELDSYKFFPSQKKEIEEIIDVSSLNEDIKGALKYKLLISDKKWTSQMRYIKYLPAYYLSCVFLIVSMYEWFKHLL